MLALLLVSIGFKAVIRLPYDMYVLFTMPEPVDPNYIFYEDSKYKYSAVNIMHSYLSYSTLRIAVFVNLARWIILYTSLRTLGEHSFNAQKISKCSQLGSQVVLWVIVVI